MSEHLYGFRHTGTHSAWTRASSRTCLTGTRYCRPRGLRPLPAATLLTAARTVANAMHQLARDRLCVNNACAGGGGSAAAARLAVGVSEGSVFAPAPAGDRRDSRPALHWSSVHAHRAGAHRRRGRARPGVRGRRHRRGGPHQPAPAQRALRLGRTHPADRQGRRRGPRARSSASWRRRRPS